MPIWGERDAAYEMFLAEDPAQRIQAYRESLGMERSAFAKQMGIPACNLRNWETGKKIISLKNWERYFEGRV